MILVAEPEMKRLVGKPGRRWKKIANFNFVEKIIVNNDMGILNRIIFACGKIWTQYAPEETENMNLKPQDSR